MNRAVHKWRPRRLPLQRRALPLLRRWLDEPGSLTRRIRRSCPGCFYVEVLCERWGSPFLDEARRLGLRHKNRVWLREVLLCCGDSAWVYGRSVIPRQTLQGRLRGLQRLGRQPLGSVLFKRYPLSRGKIEIARLAADDGLYRQVVRSVAVAPGCWVRRSVFHVAEHPLLVTEVFLPALVARAAGGGSS
ncbi:MAG: chorismate lyase [Nitrococcus mobilis]|nr:chorismate lyase [Nitrococcus mobilis]